MAEPAAAPAATETTAASPAVPAQKVIGRASDHLAEATAELAKAGTEGTGVEKQNPPAPAKDETTEDAQLTTRLSKLAAGRARLEADKRAYEERQKADTAAQAEVAKKAALWDEVHVAKTQGKTLDALRKLYSQQEIDTELYKELTADILSREPGEPITEAQVKELVAAEREAEKTAEAKRREDEATAAKEAEVAHATAVRTGYLGKVADAFESSDPGVYRAIERFKVSGDDVMKFVEEQFGATGEVPDPKAILDHFEKKLRDDMGMVLSPPAKLPTMITDSARTGSTPAVAGRKLSLKESWEQTKRELGILPPS